MHYPGEVFKCSRVKNVVSSFSLVLTFILSFALFRIIECSEYVAGCFVTSVRKLCGEFSWKLVKG